MAIPKTADHRNAQRIRCSFRGTLKYMSEDVAVRVIDISRTGLCLQLFGWIQAKPGCVIELTTQELGFMQGTLRWYRAGKMGIQVHETSNTAAKIASYFKHFHR